MTGLRRGGVFDDIGKLLWLDFMQVFAAFLQLFESLDNGLGHAAMRFIGPAHNCELLTRSDSLVTVLIIEAEPKKSGFGSVLVGLFTHAVTVLGFAGVSSGISSTAWQIISVKASS